MPNIDYLTVCYKVEYLESARSSILVGLTSTLEDAKQLVEELIKNGIYKEGSLTYDSTAIYLNLENT